MIKNNKQLITDWDSLYMEFNEDVEVKVFEKDCADEWPLINVLDDVKDEPAVFNDIIEFFYSHYACLWHNNVTGESGEVEAESPEWYEGYDEYKKQIMSLATYFKLRRVEELLGLNK